MHDHPDETLRSKEPTHQGRHLHEPDGFPHSMIGVVACVLVLVPIVVGLCYALGGIGAALIGAGIFVFAGFPFLTRKLLRGADHWRGVDQDEEHEVEHAEAHGLPHPANTIERINERLNRSPYDETVPRH